MMRNDLLKHLPQSMFDLRTTFLRHGFDIRAVGGCVRDLLIGVAPKDFDFCTDSTPAQMINIFRSEKIRYAETGLSHGTLTAILEDGAYEITSLRTETDHDGRHATVHYTKDWREDQNRRDLTINAIALTFDGDLVDPFHGQDDLRNGIVRFVGSPDERMREDYLRILRWLRFHIRIVGNQSLDADTCGAVRRNAHGLARISRERVWSEVSKMICFKDSHAVIQAMYDLGIAEHVDLPPGDIRNLIAVAAHSDNAVARLYALLGEDVFTLSETWKWSREETLLARFLHDHATDHDWKRLLVWGSRRDHVVELLKYRGVESSEAATWEMPVFPITGGDALNKGLKGKAVGEFLKDARERWFLSGFALSPSELLT